MDIRPFVRVWKGQGQIAASEDNPHAGAGSPKTQWKAGSAITDAASIPIPTELAPSSYRLVAGMYSVDPSTGKLESLPARCVSGGQYGETVSFGPIEIT